jgi:drug/metabolite transporter (DMT)-like permease
MFANLQPFLAAVFALILLHESLEWLPLVGGVAIVAGILVSRSGLVAPQE